MQAQTTTTYDVIARADARFPAASSLIISFDMLADRGVLDLLVHFDFDRLVRVCAPGLCAVKVRSAPAVVSFGQDLDEFLCASLELFLRVDGGGGGGHIGAKRFCVAFCVDETSVRGWMMVGYPTKVC